MMNRAALRLATAAVLVLAALPGVSSMVPVAHAALIAKQFSCSGAPFAFPLSTGSIWWLYRDPMTDGTPDKSGLHSGIDLFPPGNHQQRIGVPVLAPADGYLLRVGDGGFSLWHPAQGVETYYGHVNLLSQLATPWNQGKGVFVHRGDEIATVADAPDSAGGPHLHFSVGQANYGDQDVNFGDRSGVPGIAPSIAVGHLDPSPFLGADVGWVRDPQHHSNNLGSFWCSRTLWKSYLPAGHWDGNGIQISGDTIQFHALVHLAARPTPLYSAGPAFGTASGAAGHVNFTLAWNNFDGNSPWIVACRASLGITAFGHDVPVSCSQSLKGVQWYQWTGRGWNPHAVDVPHGQLQVSFDVYDDTMNLRSLAPGGVHSVQYAGSTPPPPTCGRTRGQHCTAIWTDKASYRVGESLTLCYSMPYPAPFVITDIQADGHGWRTTPVGDDGTGDCLPATVTPPTGTEHVRLDVLSSSGLVVSSAETSFQVMSP